MKIIQFVAEWVPSSCCSGPFIVEWDLSPKLDRGRSLPKGFRCLPGWGRSLPNGFCHLSDRDRSLSNGLLRLANQGRSLPNGFTSVHCTGGLVANLSSCDHFFLSLSCGGGRS